MVTTTNSSQPWKPGGHRFSLHVENARSFLKPALALRSVDIEAPEQFAPAVGHLTGEAPEAGFGILTELYKRYPNDPRAASFLGVLHYNAGRFDEASVHFARAAALANGVSVYAYNEGAALLMSRRPREAAVAFLRSLNGDELLPAAHYWAWAAFNRLGTINKVVTRLREALYQDPAQASCERLPERVDLDDVTLCVIDCKATDLAARSMRRSMAQCRFGAAKLFTSRACNYDDIEIVAIDDIASIEGYSRFVMKSLSKYIETRYALVTQWDGYVVNAGAWSDEFLGYDYIGAKWDDDVVRDHGSPSAHNVGNGGFSLRSDMFLGAGTDPRITKTHPEDTHMCRTYRPLLEEAYGIRYADAAIADRFSFEIVLPDNRPFGFHGSFNLACFEPDPKWMRFEFLGPNAFVD